MKLSKTDVRVPCLDCAKATSFVNKDGEPYCLACWVDLKEGNEADWEEDE